MRLLKAGAVYFVLVFGAGFVLGPIRILWLVPRVGERTAELMEAPIMLVVIVLAARWIARRLAWPPTPLRLLGVGFVALGLLLVVEFTVVLWLRSLTIGEYFERLLKGKTQPQLAIDPDPDMLDHPVMQTALHERN